MEQNEQARAYLDRCIGLGESACQMDGHDQMGRDELLAEWEEVDEVINGEAKKEEGRARVARARAWKEWCVQAIDKGAGRAHNFTKVAKAWVPTTTLARDGVITADPMALLQAECEKLSAQWRAKEEKVHDWYPGGKEELAPLTPDDLRRAAKTFRRRSAKAYDGFHPRHYAMLEDAGLWALACLYRATERLGRCPRQLLHITVFLGEKPKGGYRALALFTSFYRIWSKARKEIGAKWEAMNARPYFANAKGSSPTDVVWRQAMRNEKAANDGEAAGSAYWDMRAFFETIVFKRLWARAEATGFNLTILAVALNMYMSTRHIGMGGMYLVGLFAELGVPAGDLWATVLVKVYVMEPVDRLGAVQAAKLRPLHRRCHVRSPRHEVRGQKGCEAGRRDDPQDGAGGLGGRGVGPEGSGHCHTP